MHVAVSDSAGGGAPQHATQTLARSQTGGAEWKPRRSLRIETERRHAQIPAGRSVSLRTRAISGQDSLLLAQPTDGVGWPVQQGGQVPAEGGADVSIDVEGTGQPNGTPPRMTGASGVEGE